MRETIYFAHANSFPATVYRKLLAKLAEHHQVDYIDAIGHSAHFPVTDCWPHLVQETLAHLEQRATTPVIGVGHSLGGILLFYAALARPALFRGLIILDSPLLSPWRAHSIWLAKKLGFIDRITPGGNTLRRRDNWASVQRVYDYFARKPLFARFDPDCLMDYAEHGTVPNHQGGRQLKFRPQVEHAIYRTLPHDYRRYRGQLKVPALLITGQESDVLRPVDVVWLRRHFNMQVSQQAGSHLFPLERPLETAQSILQGISRLTATTAVVG